ncbi:MAG: hypothetical protein HS132_11605 [Planctomycetia bacterium]|nr:hypothetical protein [Planctomycetia bacterium]
MLHGWPPISGGYSIELAIPWSNLGLPPRRYGGPWSAWVYDDDNGGGRRQAIWIGTANNYLDTSAFGDIVLGEPPLPTPIIVTSFSINNGAAGTNRRTVTLNNTVMGNPHTTWPASRQNSTGVEWRTYSTHPF